MAGILDLIKSPSMNEAVLGGKRWLKNECAQNALCIYRKLSTKLMRKESKVRVSEVCFFYFFKKFFVISYALQFFLIDIMHLLKLMLS